MSSTSSKSSTSSTSSTAEILCTAVPTGPSEGLVQCECLRFAYDGAGNLNVVIRVPDYPLKGGQPYLMHADVDSRVMPRAIQFTPPADATALCLNMKYDGGPDPVVTSLQRCFMVKK